MTDTDISISIEHSPTIGAIAAAMATAQGEMTHALKDRTNPHFKNDYATMASVLDACRPAFSKNGIAVSQMPSTCGDGVVVTTMLIHSSGEWMSSTLTMPVAKRDAQGVGSAITYARRYALSAMAGIASDDDDDGNSAARRDASDDVDDNRKVTALNTAPLKAATKAAPKISARDVEMAVKAAVMTELSRLKVGDGLTADETKRALVAEVNRLGGGKAPTTIEGWEAILTTLKGTPSGGVVVTTTRDVERAMAALS